MDEILVNFILPTSNNVEVEAPEDMIVEDALDEMEEAEVIEASDWEWSVMFKESGQWIDISKTFAENGVTDGAALCLLHMGGAPRKQRRKEETNAL